MLIIGCDYHPAFQQIAFVDAATGDCGERRLEHREEAEKFYRELAARGIKVRVGMEASGQARWFERLLAELNFELWIGDATVIHAKRVRKQKTDRQDAQLILRLMLKDDFPQIWLPSWENRDLRQLLWHRHRMVQARTRIMNQLQAVAINEGLRCKKRLWRESGREQLEAFRLAPWASRRREGSVEVAGWAEPDDCRADASDRAGSGEISGSAAVENPPWGRTTDRTGVRADYREGRSVSVWQADRELSGAGAVGGFQREPATIRTHHETRQRSAAFPAGGSGASDGAQPPGMAQPVSPSDDEAGTENRQGRHGEETGGSLVLDDAQGMGFRKVNKVRFARGKARNRRWWEVEHRVIGWVSRSSSRRSSK